MKYIIEIEEEPFGRNDDPIIPHGMDELYRAKGFNALVFDKHGLDKMTPLDKALDEAYQKGYDEAKLIYQNPHAESDYQKGLEYAWAAARRIGAITTCGGLTNNEIKTIFGTNGTVVFNTCSVSEVIEKLNAYESHKKSEQEIKVGDEVIATNGKAVVYGVFTGNDKTLGCRYLYSDGSLGWDSAIALTKTGRHFPQIAEVLETLRGGEG